MDQKYHTNIMSGDQSISQRKFSVLFRKICYEQSKFYLVWTLILGLDASTFRCVKGACSVIPFKGACTLKWGAHLNGVVGYIYCNQQYQRIYHTPRLNNIFLLILLDLLPLPLSLYVLLIMLLSISNYGSFFFL